MYRRTKFKSKNTLPVILETIWNGCAGANIWLKATENHLLQRDGNHTSQLKTSFTELAKMTRIKPRQMVVKI